MIDLSPASPLEGLKRDREKTEYWKYIQAAASLSLSTSFHIHGQPRWWDHPCVTPRSFQHILVSHSGLQHPSCSSAGGTGQAGSHLVPTW